ncbi:MAG TPA: hypothetical protein VNJ46_00390 [Gaiellaceae bacterium]|nr:hypothetical protein [Gaiellaceae bacterium]
MPAARLATALAALLAAVLVGSASAKEGAVASAPRGLHGFLLRPSEPLTHTFSRTPAFAWSPVRGASCYEFELATSRTFDGSSVVWTNVARGAASGASCARNRIKIPAVSLNLVLPWFTGKPYALYARVRAITPRGASRWSRPYGFNMRWEEQPVPMPARPGLVRWTPVEGATAYDVWFTGPWFSKTVRTHTNVADQREHYSFHLDEEWWRLVKWRVRAVRQVVGKVPNGLPAVSYGPWSHEHTVTNPGWSSGRIRLGQALSDRVSAPGTAGPHELMPALTFSGDQGLDGKAYRLFRFYAATDRDCVNVVFTGSVVGSPAYAPRVTGPLALPGSAEALDKAFAEALEDAEGEGPKEFSAEGMPLTPNEAAGRESPSLRKIDLPDLDPRTTRYYWTVVPVLIRFADGEEGGAFEYWDVETPQDACQAGRVGVFGRESKPVITRAGSPFVSGLSPKGRLLAQAGRRPTVYSTPLVAWRPVVGATGYEVQWSRTVYPWRTVGRRLTVATSAVLDLRPGRWYYRVRGLNAAQVGTRAMAWSAPVELRIVRPTFAVARG